MNERELFLAVLDIADPAARAKYLDGACGGDPARRARVEALLCAHDSAGSFLNSPAVAPPARDPSATHELDSTATPGGPAHADHDALTFLTPARRPDSLGRIGHYEVLEVLGRGGFGIVFRAFDEALQRVVAVKVLAPQMAATSPARKRFLREARSSAQVRHENVVQVYAVEEQPLPYLVMEFIPGETLQQRLDRTGPLDVPEILRIGRQIAEGLAAAHANDLIHRDIKPGNVLLEGGQHRVKITDFGLARAADDASMTQSGTIAGTPMYMAPEQALGHTLDQRADLFSLGSVLYQMVAGRPPFRASSTLAVMKRVAEDMPRPIREIIPEAPSWLCDIIAKLHEKKPADRFQSARELADLLDDCEAQLKVNSKLKDFSRIPRGHAKRSGQWKLVAAAALVLPVLVLVLTEAAGLSHLIRGQQPKSGSIKSGFESTLPIQVAKAGTSPKGIPKQETPLAAVGAGSFTDADMKRIAALPVDDQVEEVRKELKKRNPGFDGKLIPTFEDNAVTGLEFLSNSVQNISPVRVLTRLVTLNCRGEALVPGRLSDLTPLTGMQLKQLMCSVSAVSDLTPLKGMPLTLLHVDNSAVADLSPLEGMPLKVLNCSYTQVPSLAPLTGMSLRILWCNNTQIADLAPLKGMSLEWITIQGTKVTDLSPLKAMPLTQIYLDFDPLRDREILRSLTTLQKINDKPADEFWKEVDQKE